MIEWLAEQADKFNRVFLENDLYISYFKGFGRTLKFSLFLRYLLACLSARLSQL